VFLAPPSGTINGFTKLRRSIENVLTKVTWNGANWNATRPNGVPIGSCIAFYGSALPNGYLWPDGATFTAADYVELNTVLAGNIKPDQRGRLAVGKDNMGGSAANRVTSAVSGVDGVTLGATGGEQAHTLTTPEIPSHNHTATDSGHVHAVKKSSIGAGGGGLVSFMDGSGGDPTGNTNSATANITVANTGGGGAHNNIPPAIVSNYILVAE
jgi:microcystin-dependent protein